MTQMSEAKKGNVTPEMKAVAKDERIDVEKVLKGVAKGTIVIPKNIGRDTKACGIGQGLSTKINANIGSSSKIEDIDLEVTKARLAVDFGADAIRAMKSLIWMKMTYGVQSSTKQRMELTL